jgi:hypothetical protein
MKIKKWFAEKHSFIAFDEIFFKGNLPMLVKKLFQLTGKYNRSKLKT